MLTASCMQTAIKDVDLGVFTTDAAASEGRLLGARDVGLQRPAIDAHVHNSRRAKVQYAELRAEQMAQMHSVLKNISKWREARLNASLDEAEAFFTGRTDGCCVDHRPGGDRAGATVTTPLSSVSTVTVRAKPKWSEKRRNCTAWVPESNAQLLRSHSTWIGMDPKGTSRVDQHLKFLVEHMPSVRDPRSRLPERHGLQFITGPHWTCRFAARFSYANTSQQLDLCGSVLSERQGPVSDSDYPSCPASDKTYLKTWVSAAYTCRPGMAVGQFHRSTADYFKNALDFRRVHLFAADCVTLPGNSAETERCYDTKEWGYDVDCRDNHYVSAVYLETLGVVDVTHTPDTVRLRLRCCESTLYTSMRSQGMGQELLTGANMPWPVIDPGSGSQYFERRHSHFVHALDALFNLVHYSHVTFYPNDEFARRDPVRFGEGVEPLAQCADDEYIFAIRRGGSHNGVALCTKLPSRYRFTACWKPVHPNCDFSSDGAGAIGVLRQYQRDGQVTCCLVEDQRGRWTQNTNECQSDNDGAVFNPKASWLAPLTTSVGHDCTSGLSGNREFNELDPDVDLSYVVDDCTATNNCKAGDPVGYNLREKNTLTRFRCKEGRVMVGISIYHGANTIHNCAGPNTCFAYLRVWCGPVPGAAGGLGSCIYTSGRDCSTDSVVTAVYTRKVDGTGHYDVSGVTCCKLTQLREHGTRYQDSNDRCLGIYHGIANAITGVSLRSMNHQRDRLKCKWGTFDFKSHVAAPQVTATVALSRAQAPDADKPPSRWAAFPPAECAVDEYVAGVKYVYPGGTRCAKLPRGFSFGICRFSPDATHSCTDLHLHVARSFTDGVECCQVIRPDGRPLSFDENKSEKQPEKVFFDKPGWAATHRDADGRFTFREAFTTGQLDLALGPVTFYPNGEFAKRKPIPLGDGATPRFACADDEYMFGVHTDQPDGGAFCTKLPSKYRYATCWESRDPAGWGCWEQTTNVWGVVRQFQKSADGEQLSYAFCCLVEDQNSVLWNQRDTACEPENHGVVWGGQWMAPLKHNNFKEEPCATRLGGDRELADLDPDVDLTYVVDDCTATNDCGAGDPAGYNLKEKTTATRFRCKEGRVMVGVSLYGQAARLRVWCGPVPGGVDGLGACSYASGGDCPGNSVVTAMYVEKDPNTEDHYNVTGLTCCGLTRLSRLDTGVTRSHYDRCMGILYGENQALVGVALGTAGPKYHRLVCKWGEFKYSNYSAFAQDLAPAFVLTDAPTISSLDNHTFVLRKVDGLNGRWKCARNEYIAGVSPSIHAVLCARLPTNSHWLCENEQNGGEWDVCVAQESWSTGVNKRTHRCCSSSDGTIARTDSRILYYRYPTYYPDWRVLESQHLPPYTHRTFLMTTEGEGQLVVTVRCLPGRAVQAVVPNECIRLNAYMHCAQVPPMAGCRNFTNQSTCPAGAVLTGFRFDSNCAVDRVQCCWPVPAYWAVRSKSDPMILPGKSGLLSNNMPSCNAALYSNSALVVGLGSHRGYGGTVEFVCQIAAVKLRDAAALPPALPGDVVASHSGYAIQGPCPAHMIDVKSQRAVEFGLSEPLRADSRMVALKQDPFFQPLIEALDRLDRGAVWRLDTQYQFTQPRFKYGEANMQISDSGCPLVLAQVEECQVCVSDPGDQEVAMDGPGASCPPNVTQWREAQAAMQAVRDMQYLQSAPATDEWVVPIGRAPALVRKCTVDGGVLEWVPLDHDVVCSHNAACWEPGHCQLLECRCEFYANWTAHEQRCVAWGKHAEPTAVRLRAAVRKTVPFDVHGFDLLLPSCPFERHHAPPRDVSECPSWRVHPKGRACVLVDRNATRWFADERHRAKINESLTLSLQRYLNAHQAQHDLFTDATGIRRTRNITVRSRFLEDARAVLHQPNPFDDLKTVMQRTLLSGVVDSARAAAAYTVAKVRAVAKHGKEAYRASRDTAAVLFRALEDAGDQMQVWATQVMATFKHARFVFDALYAAFTLVVDMLRKVCSLPLIGLACKTAPEFLLSFPAPPDAWQGLPDPGSLDSLMPPFGDLDIHVSEDSLAALIAEAFGAITQLVRGMAPPPAEVDTEYFVDVDVYSGSSGGDTAEPDGAWISNSAVADSMSAQDAQLFGSFQQWHDELEREVEGFEANASAHRAAARNASARRQNDTLTQLKKYATATSTTHLRTGTIILATVLLILVAAQVLVPLAVSVRLLLKAFRAWPALDLSTNANLRYSVGQFPDRKHQRCCFLRVKVWETARPSGGWNQMLDDPECKD